MFNRAATISSLTVALFTAACGAATTDATASPTARASASTEAPATATGSPLPTPVMLTVSGHVTMASDGRPVAGVRVRLSPSYISAADTTWGTRDRVPGPDAIVMSDASGAYSATVAAWSLEALARSSSSQLSLFVTPPAGMTIVAVTHADGFPSGPLAPNDPQWYFMLARGVKGPIDITLAAQ